MLDQVSYQEQILLCLLHSFFRNPVFAMLLAKASMGGQWLWGMLPSLRIFWVPLQSRLLSSLHLLSNTS